MRLALRLLLVAALVGALGGGITPAALADHLDVETSLPDTVKAGEIVEIRVTVTSAATGQRVPGATVIADREASILGFSGRVEIARATANDSGEAILRWRERSGTTSTIVVAYSEAGETDLESLPISIITVGEGPQIVRSTAGIQIPGLGAWVIVGLLVGVWAIIQFSMVGPVQIARVAAVREADIDEGSAS